jgi:membrane protease YdiL (CAAX protease family)
VARDTELASTTWQEVATYLGSFGVVAGAAGLVAGLILVIFPHYRGRWLPLPWLPAGRWTGAEVIGCFMMYFLAPGIVYGLLQSSGAFGLLYDEEPDLVRARLWTSPLALPLTLFLIATLLRLVSATQPSDLGLRKSRWPANVLLGCAAFAAVTLPLLALQAVLVNIFAWKPHELVKVAQEGLTGAEWALLFFTVVISAAVLEELLFRGLLQAWLRRASLLGQFVFVGTAWWVGLNSALVLKGEQVDWRETNWGRVAFTFLVVGAYTMLLKRLQDDKMFLTEEDFLPATSSRFSDDDAGSDDTDSGPADDASLGGGLSRNDAEARWRSHDLQQQLRKGPLAILGSSLLFALMHQDWPSSIALFLLGLVLGWLAQRTQNLLPGMLLHSLFNLTSFLAIWWLAHAGAATNGNDATTALRPATGVAAAVGSTRSSVPASWLPRRM